jgi:hypothetical protein
MLWALDQKGWTVRQANGEQRVEHPNGSRFMIRAAGGAGFGMALDLVLLDEAWDLEPAIIDDQLAPTMISKQGAQLWVISTAHPEATSLVPNLRKQALAQAEQPESLLLLEWSRHPSRDADDEIGWREASPYWDDRRRGFMRRQWQTSTEESFLSQWGNTWPTASRLALCDEETWAAMADSTLAVPSDSRQTWLALDAISGGGATLVTGWIGDDGRVCLKAEHRLSMLAALTKAHETAQAHPGTLLLLGASLDRMVDRATFPGEVVLAGIKETRQATHLFQGLALERRLCHDGDPTLARQVTGAAVLNSDAGPVMSGTRSPVPVDAARGSLWVTWAAQTMGGQTPAIY